MNNAIETFCDGKVVVIKNEASTPVPLFCSLCEYPLLNSDDCITFRRIGYCAKCADRWERDKSTQLAEGVLPDKTSEEWTEYMAYRKATSVRVINLR